MYVYINMNVCSVINWIRMRAWEWILDFGFWLMICSKATRTP